MKSKLFVRSAIIGLAAAVAASSLHAQELDRDTLSDNSSSVVIAADDPGYTATTSTTATRLDTPDRDIPRAIQVIPRELIDDRAVVRAGELADNVPGVEQSTGYGGLSTAEYFLRGFQSQATYRDGFRDFAFLTPIDVAGIERVEFLKGPASVLYGENEPGGVVNIISKRPLDDPRYAAELTVGSFNFYRVSTDLSGPILSRRVPSPADAGPKDESSADTNQSVVDYRFNFAYENAGSYRDYNESESYYLGPSFTIKITPKTTLWLFGEYQHYDYTFDRGLPPIPQSFELPISRFLGEPDAFDHDSAWRAGYELIHHFNADWQFRSAFAAIQDEQRSHFTQGFDLDPDGETLPLDATARHEKSQNYTAQNEISGRFDTSPVGNHFLFGVEYSPYRFSYDIGEKSFENINIFHPVYDNNLSTFALPFDPKQDYGADLVGVYAQDLVTLLPNLKLSLAGRYDYAKTIEDYRPAAVTVHEDNAFSPQVGLVYQPVQPVSLYADWTRSFNPNYGLSRTGQFFAPEKGEQFEVGVKTEFFNQRLSSTLALYHITKSNVLATDPTDPNYEILTGEQKSEGVEFNAIGQPVDGWKILASYSYTSAFVSKDTTIPLGDPLPGVPRNQAGLWTSYDLKFLPVPGFGIGTGLYYYGKSEATLPNNGVSIPSYWRWDAALYYKRNHWRAQINFKNITDRRYYATQGYELTPQAPFTVLGTVGMEF